VPTRLRTLQRDLLDSLWFTPTVIALVYAALALVLLRADQALGLDTRAVTPGLSAARTAPGASSSPSPARRSPSSASSSR
jgi:hypothetical protein